MKLQKYIKILSTELEIKTRLPGCCLLLLVTEYVNARQTRKHPNNSVSMPGSLNAKRYLSWPIGIFLNNYPWSAGLQAICFHWLQRAGKKSKLWSLYEMVKKSFVYWGSSGGRQKLITTQIYYIIVPAGADAEMRRNNSKPFLHLSFFPACKRQSRIVFQKWAKRPHAPLSKQHKQA